MRRPLATGLVIACVSLLTPQLALSDGSVYTQAESFSFSDAVPAKSYLNFLIGPPPKGGTHALSRNRIEVGIDFGTYGFAIFHRNDYNLDFSSDTADFSWRNKNRQTIPLGKEYEIDVWANQYQLTGLEFTRDWALSPKVDLTLAASYFIATEGIYGYIGQDPERPGDSGVVSMQDVVVNGETRRILAGNLYADYYYTDDVLFESDAHAPVGKGYTIDLALAWRITENLTLDAKLEDLAGKIYWDDMPRTLAWATSDVFVQDEEGFWHANPSFAGQQMPGDFEQPLRSRERVALSYQLEKFTLGYEYDRLDVVDFTRLGIAYNWNGRWGSKIAFEQGTGAIHLGLKMPLGQLSLMFDDMDVDKAHSIGFGWSFHAPFVFQK